MTLKASSQVLEEDLCLRVGLLVTRKNFPTRLDYFKELIKFLVKNQSSFSAEELIDLFHPRVFVADPLAIYQLKKDYKFVVSYSLIESSFVGLLVEFFYPILQTNTLDLYLFPEAEKDRLVFDITQELSGSSKKER